MSLIQLSGRLCWLCSLYGLETWWNCFCDCCLLEAFVFTVGFTFSLRLVSGWNTCSSLVHAKNAGQEQLRTWTENPQWFDIIDEGLNGRIIQTGYFPASYVWLPQRVWLLHSVDRKHVFSWKRKFAEPTMLASTRWQIIGLSRLNLFNFILKSWSIKICISDILVFRHSKPPWHHDSLLGRYRKPGHALQRSRCVPPWSTFTSRRYLDGERLWDCGKKQK